MSLLSIVQLLVALFYISYIFYPLTVTIHELGHAIPTLYFTKGQVKIYIGTQDKETECFHFTLNRLEFFYSKKPFDWRYGMTQGSENTLPVSQMIITAGGSLLSLFFGIIAICFAIFTDLHDFWRFYLLAFFVSSLRDFYHNLLSKSSPPSYNDRYLLEKEFHAWSITKKYRKGYDLYFEKKYAESLNILLEVLEKEEREDIYRIAVSAAIEANEIPTAFKLFEKQKKNFSLEAADYTNMSRAYSKIGDELVALQYLNAALELNPRSSHAYNNLGASLCRMKKFAEAERNLDKAILCADTQKKKAVLPSAYNLRGFVKLHLQRPEEALRDIEYALTLQPTNSYIHRNLGIYYYEKGAFSKALTHFENSYKLNEKTEFVADYLTKTKAKL